VSIDVLADPARVKDFAPGVGLADIRVAPYADFLRAHTAVFGGACDHEVVPREPSAQAGVAKTFAALQSGAWMGPPVGAGAAPAEGKKARVEEA
jgi:hypothetical protein